MVLSQNLTHYMV